MNIVELYKDKISSIWHDGKTYLAVFDDNDKMIADYDLSSGIKILQDDDTITFFITEEELVPGTWKFFGTKVIQQNEKNIEEKVQSSGKLEGDSRERVYLEEDPWNTRRVEGEYVSSKEREERMDICRSCPFFISEDGTCSINGNFVIESTRHVYSFCPEEKWGDKELVIERMSVAPEGDIILPEAVVIAEEEQSEFEAELEEYLKGL